MTRARRLLVTLALAALLPAASAHGFAYQSVPGPASGTNGIALAPDGTLWVSEEFNSSVAHLTASGTVIKEYAGIGGEPQNVINGPGGRIWVAVGDPHKLTWFDATSTNPTPHDVVLPSNCPPRGLVAGADGRIYFSQPSVDGVCNGGISVVGSVAGDGSGAVSTTSGRGEVYDLAASGQTIFAPDAGGDVIRRLGLGTALTVQGQITAPAGSAPNGVAVSGDTVWVTLFNASAVARFPLNATGGAVSTVVTSPSTLQEPYYLTVGNDGRVYVGGKASNDVVRISTDGSTQTYPAPGSEPLRPINGPDGDILVTDQLKTSLLRLVNSAPRVTTGTATATAPTSGSVASTVDPRGNQTSLVFDYGPTTAYGSTSSALTAAGGIGPVSFTGVLANLTPGTLYHVRARATNAEGSTTGADTTFTTPAAPPVLVDVDHDGFSPPADCNDLDPNIHPGAVDIPGDGIDQDCSGKDAAYPELTATTNFAYRFRGSRTIVTSIAITRLSGGETATIRCTGKGCPFKTKSFKDLKRGSKTIGRKTLKNRSLRSGATMSVRVTKTRSIGTYTSLKARKGKAAKITRLCLTPGKSSPAACR